MKQAKALSELNELVQGDPTSIGIDEPKLFRSWLIL